MRTFKGWQLYKNNDSINKVLTNALTQYIAVAETATHTKADMCNMAYKQICVMLKHYEFFGANDTDVHDALADWFYEVYDVLIDY